MDFKEVNWKSELNCNVLLLKIQSRQIMFRECLKIALN